jgi:hypothetical protein
VFVRRTGVLAALRLDVPDPRFPRLQRGVGERRERKDREVYREGHRGGTVEPTSECHGTGSAHGAQSKLERAFGKLARF